MRRGDFLLTFHLLFLHLLFEPQSFKSFQIFESIAAKKNEFDFFDCLAGQRSRCIEMRRDLMLAIFLVHLDQKGLYHGEHRKRE